MGEHIYVRIAEQERLEIIGPENQILRMSAKTTRLKNGLEIRRILNGMWQVSGTHGRIDPQLAAEDMMSYYKAGLTTFDMADIYGPAETIYGKFIHKLLRGGEDISKVQGLTKWVPRPGPMSEKITRLAIARSCQQMNVEKLDCVQFHWWDYSDKRYLDALRHLSGLQKEGKIGELALTNFDTDRMREITKAGISLSSNQVQYSLIDMRPSQKMAKFCEENGIKLLTYGTLCGGLLSEKYLDAPEPKGKSELNTASLSKYKNMIDTWGGWRLFQELLQELDKIAKAHNVAIANVATKYILDQKAVGGVIVGCRLGVPGANHLEQNLKTFSLEITPTEKDNIEKIISRGRDLLKVIGDCGDEYR